MEESRQRCFGSGDVLYEQYHDEEWGHPPEVSPDERELLERLVLEGFQSGLSWITILRRRDAFRDAFGQFEPAVVAAFDEDDVIRLKADERIIRNERKIRAAIQNARALVALHEQGQELGKILEEYRPELHEPAASWPDGRAESPESRELARRLKQLGFTFVGPVTVYALMQAIGMVFDHPDDCPLGRDTPAGKELLALQARCAQP